MEGTSRRTPVAEPLDSEEDRRSAKPRKPLQKRSRERFQALLDATDGLLAERDPNEVGLYDIAERAKVPPASVYHFFPTKDAVFVALAERYLEQLYEVTRQAPLDRSRIRHWSDVFVMGSRRTIDFYNSHPVLLKLFFGGALSSEIRSRDVEYTRSLSEGGYDWLNKYFVMPYLPDAERKFSVLWSIYDGVTMTSYQLHGHVTPEYFDEMVRAVVAYCRTFLPEVLALRPPPEQP